MKYSGRKPKTAKALALQTTKGLVVIAKIAGMESTAKTKSVVPTTTTTANSGVARSLPALRTKNFSPSKPGVTETSRRTRRRTGLRSG